MSSTNLHNPALSKKWVCDYCLKSSKKPISLICEHLLCFGCGSNLLKVQAETLLKCLNLSSYSQLQSKYRITCPKCKKITYTYDINNLILNSSCSVTKNFSTDTPDTKKSSSHQQTHNNNNNRQIPHYPSSSSFQHCSPSTTSSKKHRSQSRKSDLSLRKINSTALYEPSTHANNNKNTPTSPPYNPSFSKHNNIAQPICKNHTKPYTLFCEQHVDILCDQCAQSSAHAHHTLVDVSKGLPRVLQQNIQKRREGMTYLSDMQNRISSFLKLKQEYQDAYRKLCNQVNQEFTVLEGIIKERKEELANIIDKFYQPKIKLLQEKIADLSELRLKLKDPTLLAGFDSIHKELEFYKIHSDFKAWIEQLEREINDNTKHSISLEKSGQVAMIKMYMQNYMSVQLWTKMHAGKISSPSQYFARKSIKKRKMSNSSSNIRREHHNGECRSGSAEVTVVNTDRPKKMTATQGGGGRNTTDKKLKQYGF